MREINLSADELIKSLLNLEKERNVCILDSCGVSHHGSHLLIAGLNPVEILEINETDANKTLEILDKKLSKNNLAAIFTISYDFGLKLNKIIPRKKEFTTFPEPDIFLALFDSLIIHNYNSHKTFLLGNETRFDEIEKLLITLTKSTVYTKTPTSKIFSNFSRENYLSTVEKIQEFIRRGDTYQTNLTQQIRAILPDNLTPEQIFSHLRQNNPVPFASFLRRKNDVVISASPERFFRVKGQRSKVKGQIISVSPIKGTRPRGKTENEDVQLKNELLNSEKDRAENVMIVDLLRNDIGRICKFGSVKVEELCDLETHPTLFHLVSTVSGELKENTKLSDIIRATFPCGSITGAPKIRTMQIIDELETVNRGLSMGTVGFWIGDFGVGMGDSKSSIQTPQSKIQNQFDLSVAIRTMVIRENEAIFNVGGGIVIDSIPENEYAETLVKAEALLNSIGANGLEIISLSNLKAKI